MTNSQIKVNVVFNKNKQVSNHDNDEDLNANNKI